MKNKKRLDKTFVRFVLPILLVYVWGCATEYNLATQREESLLYGTEKEIKIGDAVAQQIEKNYKIITDIDINDRIQKIFDRIVAVCDRRELVYTVRIIDEDKTNAVSLPGGYVYVFKGLIDKSESDDEIAGVLAHEVGHIAAKHGMKRLQASYGYALLQVLSVQAGGAAARGVQTAYLSVFLAHSRQDEFLADKLGVKYLRKAGYDPNGMASFLKKLQEENRKAPIRPLYYGRTHPYVNERIAIVNQAVTGELEFRDYLNLMGTEDTPY